MTIYIVLRKRLSSSTNNLHLCSLTEIPLYERLSILPDLGASPFSTIVTDSINVDGVEKLLAGLQLRN